MKAFLILTLLLLLNSIESISQAIKSQNVGVICNNGIKSGTGFIVNKPNIVVTCAHVIPDTLKEISLVLPENEKKYVLTIMKYDSLRDVAILKSKENICEFPLILNTNPQLFLLDSIEYSGYTWYSTVKNGEIVKPNPVEWHISYIEKVNNSFIEFESFGLPGYSGGPVLKNNQVIAIISRGGWKPKSDIIKSKGILAGKNKWFSLALYINDYLKYME